MNVDEAVALARTLMNQWGLETWKFGLNRRKKTLGLCYFPTRTGKPGCIMLSIHLIRHNGVAEVRDVILHEIAHALAGSTAGHGPAWLAMAVKVGARPKRCGNAAMPHGPWRATCPGCGKLYSRHRKPGARVFWCISCGPGRGTILYHKAS